MKPNFRFTQYLNNIINRINKRFLRPGLDPYQEAKQLLNLRLTWVVFLAGFTYSFTFISTGKYHIFLFAIGMSFCLLIVPFTLKRGFNSATRNLLFFLCGLIFVCVNALGAGNEITLPIVLWLILGIQLSIAILDASASFLFSLIVVVIFFLHKYFVFIGYQFPFIIPEETVLAPRWIDIIIPIFLNLFLAYNSLSLARRAQDQMKQSREQEYTLNEALAVSEYRYRLIVEKSLGYITIHDETGKLVFINNAASQSLGYLPSEMKDKLVSDFLHSSVKAAFPSYLGVVLSKGSAEGIMKMSSKEGKVLYWYYRNVKLSNTGKEIQILGFAQDVTELEITRQQLSKARTKAEESDKLKSVFLANMSHEIRTPMNAIVGFSELLERPEIIDEKRARFTRQIRERSMDLLHIINNIMDFSRLEAGQVPITNTEGNIDEMMNRLIDTISAESIYLENKKVSLEKINGLKPESNYVKLDFIRLSQVLSNLLSNALKFTAKGKISLRCEQVQANELQFSISDTGEGISPEKMNVIFKPFRQADDSIQRKHGGSGLGLAICKGLVEAWGGKIWVTSNGEQGTTFFVTVKYQPIPDKSNEA